MSKILPYEPGSFTCQPLSALHLEVRSARDSRQLRPTKKTMRCVTSSDISCGDCFSESPFSEWKTSNPGPARRWSLQIVNLGSSDDILQDCLVYGQLMPLLATQCHTFSPWPSSVAMRNMQTASRFQGLYDNLWYATAVYDYAIKTAKW